MFYWYHESLIVYHYKLGTVVVYEEEENKLESSLSATLLNINIWLL